VGADPQSATPFSTARRRHVGGGRLPPPRSLGRSGARIAVGAQKQQIEIPLDVVADIPGKVDASVKTYLASVKQTRK